MGFSTQSDSTRVKITEVNMQEGFVQGNDAFGKTYRMMMDTHGAVVMIPATGELWRAKRRGNEWVLDSRFERGEESTTISSLAPGDRRLEAQNDLHLNGQSVKVNGAALIPSGTILLFDATKTTPEGWRIWTGATPPTGTVYIIRD